MCKSIDDWIIGIDNHNKKCNQVKILRNLTRANKKEIDYANVL